MKIFSFLHVVGLISLAAASDQAHRQLDDPLLPANATVEVFINCGSKQNYVDDAGMLWIKDTYFQGGGMFVTPLIGIKNTVDDELYRTSRYEYKVRVVTTVLKDCHDKEISF